MKAAIGRIFVFLPARRAQHELAHRRVRTVVRNVDNNGVARAAIGAVRERILKSTVDGIKEFGAAVCAGGEVGENIDRLRRVRIAVVNLKLRRGLRGDPVRLAYRHH
jgi:hypothetical protein